MAAARWYVPKRGTAAGSELDACLDSSLGWCLGWLHHELVTDAVQRAEVNRIGRIPFELLTELEHLIIDDAGGGEEAIAPDIVEELFAGDDAIDVREEVAEELELVCGEGDGCSSTVDLHLLEIYDNLAELATGFVGNGRDRGVGSLGAADGGLNAGQELAGAEGLGDVVIGTDLEKENLVGDLADGAEDDDGAVYGVGLDEATDLASGHAGKHEVEDDGCRIEFATDLCGSLSFTDDLDLVAFGGELALQDLLDSWIVFHDEDGFHGF
jgi:hypothetical protein